MAKRPFGQSNPESQERRQGSSVKRQKNTGAVPLVTLRQLQNVFTEYSNAAKLQDGIQSFKKFLADCRDLQHVLHINEESQLVLLQEFLDGQLSQDGEETCGDIMQAWSFASQSNNFQLLSSLPTVLHLLLRTIALFPAWKKHGTALAKTVLQPSYLKIIYRSLGGNKDSISSPCLRLLTEINKFDNGALTTLLHQSVDFTVKDLGKNLEVKKADKTDPEVEDPERPSVRTVFVRFILSFFQYASPRIKTDIMGLRTFTTPLFKHIRQDTAVLVEEILLVFQNSIISDLDIPRSAKTNYFNHWSLNKIVDLCYRDDAVDGEQQERKVADVVYDFLARICTTPGNGICFNDSGWYTGAKLEASEDTKGRPLNNRILLSFITSLRPHSNEHHQKLLLAILRASPELVAAYFNDNAIFTFEPKFTMTWVGLSYIALQTIQMEVPAKLGYPVEASRQGTDAHTTHDTPNMPPPIKNMMENILPQPLTTSILTKGITFSSKNLVKLLSTRVLNAAFKKLSAVLDTLDTLSLESTDIISWSNVMYDLRGEFSKRVPEASVIFTTLNQTPEQDILLREALTRLLLNYHKYLPSLVAQQSFDFAPIFTSLLSKIDDSKGFKARETTSCLELAGFLPQMKWWNKPSGSKYSPAMGLVKVYVGSTVLQEDKNGYIKRKVFALLEKVFDANTLITVEDKGNNRPLKALLNSLVLVRAKADQEKVLEYLGNACDRFSQGPYKFYDIIGGILRLKVFPKSRVERMSPLMATLIHQFRFVDHEKDEQTARTLSQWLLNLSHGLTHEEEKPLVLEFDQDIDLAEYGFSKEGDMLQQFVEGLRLWRDLLVNLKIEPDVRKDALSTPITNYSNSPPPSENTELASDFVSTKVPHEHENAKKACAAYLEGIGINIDSLTEKKRNPKLLEKIHLIIYDLTVQLSEPKLEDLTLELCQTFANLIIHHEVDLTTCVRKDALSNVLEVAFEKLDKIEVIEFAAAVLGWIDDVQSLPHSKLLQSVLSTDNKLSQRQMSPQSTLSDFRGCYLITFIIKTLFSASESAHSNVTTLDGILSLYRGSNDAVDTTLQEIIMKIEGYLSKSIIQRIASAKISDGNDIRNFIERDNKGRLHIKISAKMLQTSVACLYPRKLDLAGYSEDRLTTFSEKCKVSFEQEMPRSITYDLTIIAAVVMNSMFTSTDDTKLDIKDIIDNWALSYVILGLASENGEERAMSIWVISEVIRKLENPQGSWRYKERGEVLPFLCKILASVMKSLESSDSNSEKENARNDYDNETDKDSIKSQPMPTLTALFLARALPIAANPSHILYAKIMQWVHSRPTFRMNEVPLLKELLRPESDTYWKELDWILQILADGMRSQRDMDICRSYGVFEETMGMYQAFMKMARPGQRYAGNWEQSKEMAMQKKILQILWNAAGVETGATTLMTRTGVIGWATLMLAYHGSRGTHASEEASVTVQRLAFRLWSACDIEYIERWSNGGIFYSLTPLMRICCNLAGET